MPIKRFSPVGLQHNTKKYGGVRLPCSVEEIVSSLDRIVHYSIRQSRSAASGDSSALSGASLGVLQSAMGVLDKIAASIVGGIATPGGPPVVAQSAYFSLSVQADFAGAGSRLASAPLTANGSASALAPLPAGVLAQLAAAAPSGVISLFMCGRPPSAAGREGELWRGVHS